MGRPSRIKIVWLAAIWNFFWGGNGKLQTTAFFAKTPSRRHFCEGKFFRDRTKWNLTSWGFRKCGSFWASFLRGVIAAQSRIMSAKVEVSPKLGGVKKKRHGHNFDFSGLKRIGWVTNRVDQTCYSFHAWKIKIVAVSFFLTPHFALKKNWKITRLWQPITSL